MNDYQAYQIYQSLKLQNLTKNNMKSKKTKVTRAYIKLVTNKKARTNSSKEYFQVFAEDGEAFLFTITDMDKAAKRASKNPEDVYPVEFVEPKPEVIIKQVIKYVEVEKPGFFKRLFNKLTGK